MRHDCDVCQHAKVDVIDAALDKGRHPNLVRVQYRLDPGAFQVHLAHRAQTPIARDDYPGQSLRDTPMAEPVLPQAPMHEPAPVQSRIAEAALPQAPMAEPLPAQSLRAVLHRAPTQDVQARITLNALLQQSLDACACEWCTASGYERLKRAWREANDQEKQRFCVDTRSLDVPF